MRGAELRERSTGPKREEGWAGKAGSGPAREKRKERRRAGFAGPEREFVLGHAHGPRAGEGKRKWAGRVERVVQELVGRVGLGFLVSFPFLFQTKLKLFEFKTNLNSTPMHSYKIKPCTSMHATTRLNLENFNYL